jgi:hypothetical protein
MLLVLATVAPTMAVSTKPAEAQWYRGWGYRPYYYGGHFSTGLAVGTAIGAGLGLLGGTFLGEHYGLDFGFMEVQYGMDMPTSQWPPAQSHTSGIKS